VLGHSKEYDGGYAQVSNLLYRINNPVQAVAINAGHGWDLFHYVLSVPDKDGVYQVIKGKPGLSDEPSYVF